MRQIGVRDEAKTVRGIAPCGRACCCSYWLHRFTPINIRMVKEQNLALNPTKISGICGRLMCCMAYEHSHYGDLWKSLPNPGTKIKTAQGNYVLEGVDLQTESVKVRFPEGREVPISIAEFADFKETVLRGEEWKETPKEDVFVTRRPLLPFRSTISSRAIASSKPLRPVAAATHTADSAKNAVRDVKNANLSNNRKFKPEKISIEEHIAERIGKKAAEPPTPKPYAEAGAASMKKRPRRPKGGGTNAPAFGEGQTAQSVKETAPKGANPAPFRGERPRPPRQPLAETQKDGQKGTQKDTQGGYGRNRSHYSAYNPEHARDGRSRERHGPERQGPGRQDLERQSPERQGPEKGDLKRGDLKKGDSKKGNSEKGDS
jgi:hypothetical protein